MPPSWAQIKAAPSPHPIMAGPPYVIASPPYVMARPPYVMAGLVPAISRLFGRPAGTAAE
jgi:hypothetical protein